MKHKPADDNEPETFFSRQQETLEESGEVPDHSKPFAQNSKQRFRSF